MVSVAELNERDIKSPFLPKAAFWGWGSAREVYYTWWMKLYGSISIHVNSDYLLGEWPHGSVRFENSSLMGGKTFLSGKCKKFVLGPY